MGNSGQMFKILAITFAFIGFAVAIYAAWLWWKASRVAIREPQASISDVPELHIYSTQVAYNEASELNARAAFWTGIAAVCSALGSVFGVL